jgi:flagellar basal-body rod protein FlgC
MIFSVCSSLSAIRAYSVKMGVHADNVANANTEEFKKRKVVLEEGPRNDVQVNIEQVDTPGPTVTEITGDQIEAKELSNVDLAEEIPQTILTRNGLEANAVTLKTLDEMLGSVIDILE